MYEEALISIIMPAFCSAKTICKSIQSVQGQTYIKWELIVVDDASTDQTVSAVKTFSEADSRIKIIVLEENIGVSEARNIGLKNANGRYIAFLDSDDFWLPEKLEKQISFMQREKIAFSYTQYRNFADTDNDRAIRKLIDVKEIINYKELLKGNQIGCLTVMIDKKYINDFSMPSCRHEDYATWLNILKQGFLAYGIKADLARYRKNPNSLSGNKIKSLFWTWKLYRTVQNLSIFQTGYYFLFYIIKGIKKHF